MKFQYSHVVGLWLKFFTPLKNKSLKGEKVIIVLNMITTLLILLFVSLYYIKSYQIPTRHIDIDTFPVTCDTLCINKVTIKKDYLKVSGNITFSGLFPGFSSSEKHSNIPERSFISISEDGFISFTDSICNNYSQYFKDFFVSPQNLSAKEIGVSDSRLRRTNEIVYIGIKQNLPNLVPPLSVKEPEYDHLLTNIDDSVICITKLMNSEDEFSSDLVFLSSSKIYSLSQLPISRDERVTIHPILLAEDCSQTNYDLHFQSEKQLSINELTIKFDCNVTFSAMCPEPTCIGADFISFIGTENTDKLIKNGLKFNTINSDNTNMMLMKMFVLTALITALFAFLTRQFYSLLKDKIQKIVFKNSRITLLLYVVIWIGLLLLLFFARHNLF